MQFKINIILIVLRNFIMFSKEYCRALELRMFKKSKEIHKLRSQLFFLKIISFTFVCLFFVSQMQIPT